METQAIYTFTVSPEVREYTAAELRQIKRDYLQRGLDDFDNLAMIVTTFGHDARVERTNYRIWQRGRVTALYTIKTGNYITTEKRYAETEVMAVFLDLRGIGGLKSPDRTQVCYLKKGDDVIDSEQVFIPGQWLESMLLDLPAALIAAYEIQAETRAAEVAGLMKELMIGKDI
jgi:hypothetical protein